MADDFLVLQSERASRFITRHIGFQPRDAASLIYGLATMMRPGVAIDDAFFRSADAEIRRLLGQRCYYEAAIYGRRRLSAGRRGFSTLRALF